MKVEVLNTIEYKETRAGFGKALIDLAEEKKEIVALCADLTESLKMSEFAKKYPHRFFKVGIAEANMVGIAAGLATSGFIPFVGSFAVFLAGRAYDQIRQSVAYSMKNVKLIASHSGLTVGEDGATHQAIEDIALMTALPNMVVVYPADFNQAYNATYAIANYFGPVYLRLGRPAIPNFTPKDLPFILGKGILFSEGNDVSIFATGPMLWHTLLASSELISKNIYPEIINIHTIKPIDKDLILNSIKKTNCAVVVEEHTIFGGLGDNIARIAAHHYPIPIEYVAINDTFGESGKPDELLNKYGLTTDNIIKACINVLKKKKDLVKNL